MYARRTWDAGDYRIIKNYHTGKLPDKKRGKRKNQSTLAMEAYNLRLRIEKVQLLIMANFREHDLWVTLTYKKDGERPGDTCEAKKNLKAFLRKLKTWYRRLGMELKWIGLTEKGKKGSYHHHLLLNRAPGISEAVSSLWTWGHPSVVRLYKDGAYRKLSEYIVKSETKDSGEFLHYSRSRNLITPEPKTEEISSGTFREDPKEKKGWILLKDTVEEGVNPFTGYRYQRYIMQRVRYKKRE